MLNRLNELSFVIGIFFTIVSLILSVNLVTREMFDALSLYTAAAFLIFGLMMMFAGKKK